MPARVLGWLFGTIGDWLGYFDGRQGHDAFTLKRTDLGVGSSSLTKLTAVQQTTAIGAPANRQASILASGTTASAFPSFEFLNDGSSPSNLTNFGGGGVPTSAPASDASGVIFWGAVGNLVKSSSNGCASSTTVTVTGQTTQVDWVGFTASHYLAYETSTKKLYRATALGGAWSSLTLTASASTLHDLVTNGAGTWVLVTSVAISATVIYCSIDDGVTWSTIPLGSTFSSSAGACYSADWGRFVVLNSAGEMWTSIDGTTWALSKTVAALAGLTLGQNTLAACGPAIACLTNRVSNAIGKYPYGLAYTLNQGANWNEIYFGSALGSNPIANLISANGRLYAIDGAALYQTGVMVAPTSLFTGV